MLRTAENINVLQVFSKPVALQPYMELLPIQKTKLFIHVNTWMHLCRVAIVSKLRHTLLEGKKGGLQDSGNLKGSRSKRRQPRKL